LLSGGGKEETSTNTASLWNRTKCGEDSRAVCRGGGKKDLDEKTNPIQFKGKGRGAMIPTSSRSGVQKLTGFHIE